MTSTSNIQNLRNRNDLKLFINSIFRKEKRKLVYINYVFCTDNELLKINRDFLGHNYFTDIISFNLSKEKNKIEAEIYISVERVRENAEKLKESINQEIHRVIFHGTLHMIGYNDRTWKEKKLMRKKEDFYLSKYSRMCST